MHIVLGSGNRAEDNWSERGDGVMTCRDFILYILENGLEDEQVFKDGKFIGFKTVAEVAEELEVGVETVRAWAMLGMITYVELYGVIFIPANYKSPIERGKQKHEK